MPLRCFDPTRDSDIHAFDLSPDEWQALVLANRKKRHLRMPCCASRVVLRRSRRGTPHFVHKAVGTCSTAPETEAHLRLKRMAVDAARANGWHAETEAGGTTASGEPWRADVLARKGEAKVAVEIQWSSQTVDETWRRQKRYAQSGIRCLWLLRQTDIPVDRDLPAVGIGGSAEEGFVAIVPTVPTGWGTQSMPMGELLDAAFGKRLRFGLPLDVAATVSVRAGHMDCWSCGCETQIITGIDVAAGPNEYQFSIPDIGEYPDLFEIVRSRFPSDRSFDDIKRRFSKTQNRFYLSNGCAHCDAIVGEFYEREAWEAQETVCAFPVRTSERWRQAILNHDGYRDGWGVYPAR